MFSRLSFAGTWTMWSITVGLPPHHHSVKTLLVNVSSFIFTKNGLCIRHGNCSFRSVFSLWHCRPQNPCQYSCKSGYPACPGPSSWVFQIIYYLSCYSQSVLVNGFTSSSKPLGCGVPQGSVGVPTLFSIYLTGLRNILQCHSVHYHLYVHDIQMFVSFPPNQTQASQAVRNLEKCIADIDAWRIKFFAVNNNNILHLYSA